MKISDLYKLPMITESDCILDNSCRYKIDFDTSDSNCEEQIKAVSVAINNHEALVELLTKITPKIELANHEHCGGCYTFLGGEAETHSEDCEYHAAINLLEKIKGELNDN